MRKKAGECTLFLAALLAASALLPPAFKGQGSLPPDIETLYDSGQYRQAAEALQVALERYPQDASLDYWLGRSLFEVREFSKAIERFERTVKIDTNSSITTIGLVAHMAAKPKRTAIPTCPPLFPQRAVRTTNSKLPSNLTPRI